MNQLWYFSKLFFKKSLVIHNSDYNVGDTNSGFSSPRINLSPFTKDFRGEEQYNESISIFEVL